MINKFHKRDEEYKIQAVRAVKSGRHPKKVAELCEVSDVTVYAWCRKYGKQVEAEGPITGEVMVKPRKIYEEEFRLAAVQEVKKGRKVAEVAEECGVSTNAVYEWCAKYSETLEQRGTVMSVEELQAKLTAADEEEERKKKEQEEAQRKEDAIVAGAMAHLLIWMQGYSKTKDSHWREAEALSPYRSFPDKPYFPPLVDGFNDRQVVFVEKSRNMMLSWLTRWGSSPMRQ